MSWTPEQIENLRFYWERGTSAASIGLIVGKSKNAVVGKAHRLGLAGRDSPIAARLSAETKAARARDKAAKSNRRPPKTFPPMEAAREPKRPGAPCLWPADMDGGPSRDAEGNLAVCGQPRHGDKPYCAAHCRRAYVRKRGDLGATDGGAQCQR